MLKMCFVSISNKYVVWIKQFENIAARLDESSIRQKKQIYERLAHIIHTVVTCGNEQEIGQRGHFDTDPINLDNDTLKNKGNFRVV